MPKRKTKHIKLEHETLILFNQVKGSILKDNPQRETRLTDDLTVRIALRSYLGGR